MAMFLDYKLKGELGKGFFRQLHHLITLDMGMVFKRNNNKLDCRQCLSIASFYKTVCVKSRYPPFHPILCYRYRDVDFCCT